MRITCQSKFVNGLQKIYFCMQSSRPVQTKSRKLTGLDRPLRITCQSKFVNGLQEIYFCMQSSRPVQTKSRKLTGLDRPIRITCQSKFVNGLQEIYFCMQSSWACLHQLKNTENRSHCLKSKVLKTKFEIKTKSKILKTKSSLFEIIQT